MNRPAGPAAKLRECREAAADARHLGLDESRRNFITFALYWRRMKRADRRDHTTDLPTNHP